VSDENSKRDIIKSLRLSRTELDAIKTECRKWDIGFSAFVRGAAVLVASFDECNTEVV
jgi:hypothetical protein